MVVFTVNSRTNNSVRSVLVSVRSVLVFHFYIIVQHYNIYITYTLVSLPTHWIDSPRWTRYDTPSSSPIAAAWPSCDCSLLYTQTPVANEF